MLHLPSGTYLGLDSVASRIVELLNENPEPANVARALSDRFGITYEQALTDVGGVIAAVQGLSAPRHDRGRRPTVAGVRVVAGSWLRQPLGYRLATLRAAAVVCAIEVGLKAFNLSTLTRWLHVPLATDQTIPPIVTPDDLLSLTESERRSYWAVQWVLARWIFDGTCLRQALALGWFLRHRKPVLRLGMIDDTGSIAHAWLDVAGQTFNAQPVTGTFGARKVRTITSATQSPIE